MPGKLMFSPDGISTRPKRRRAVEMRIAELKVIRGAGEDYIHRIPLNLQSGDVYSAADNCIETLADAIDILSDIYYQ